MSYRDQWFIIIDVKILLFSQISGLLHCKVCLHILIHLLASALRRHHLTRQVKGEEKTLYQC